MAVARRVIYMRGSRLSGASRTVWNAEEDVNGVQGLRDRCDQGIPLAVHNQKTCKDPAVESVSLRVCKCYRGTFPARSPAPGAVV